MVAGPSTGSHDFEREKMSASDFQKAIEHTWPQYKRTEIVCAIKVTCKNQKELQVSGVECAEIALVGEWIHTTPSGNQVLNDDAFRSQYRKLRNKK